jgi:hypothetical protein
MRDAGLFQPAQQGFEEALPKPALVHKSIEPAALAMIMGSNG